ncbi:hypothetical protein FOA43_001306 [Brettanomyces nanus]|uniref:Large ribosomal subunit protein mL38 n=1 Tax=Eeniella nana TaxID=13502 RepID=A0A875S2D3_EENNA|nr:uncharacterized protein FOA43_001306 [Brettanomyces nanus]QPG73989.1 hypothetical protein FOA43_001306 [Brettanomyces nanus]
MSLSKGIWSTFNRRSPSLALRNKKLQKALLSPNLPEGPFSLKKRSSKIRYISPTGMDEIYPLAYQFLEKQSADVYKKIENMEKKCNVEQSDELKRTLTKLQVEAEENNPEVVYNAMFGSNLVDRTQPVYRHYLEQKWKDYGRMLIMQRLESLAVIPDTLPTLEPQVEVKMKFPCNNVERWIEPGDILSSNVTSRPPMLEVIEFEECKRGLYTVLVVDPDSPDVENDSYSTTLHWGLKNVELSNQDGIIDARKLVKNPDCEFASYLAPTPEKNTGKHRFSVWIFRQKKEIDGFREPVGRERFDIRKFTADNELHAVGAHVWRSIWDRNVNNVRKMYGMGEGRVFAREKV